MNNNFEQQQFGKKHYLKRFKDFDPDWDQAQKHGLASQVGFSTEQGIRDRCWCCFQQIYKQSVRLTQNTKQLQFLGFGFPLYYAFIRNCIFLLIVTIFSYNFISLYKAISINKNFCSQYKINNLSQQHNQINYYKEFQQKRKDNNYISMRHYNLFPQHSFLQQNKKAQKNNNYLKNQNSKKLSEQQPQKNQASQQIKCTSWSVYASRMQKQVTTDEQILRGASFAIHLIILIYIRDKIVKMRDYFDERTNSPSDYAVMITHLPKINDIRNKLKYQIAQVYSISDVVQIILIPNMDNYEKIEEHKSKTIQKLRKKIKKNQFDQEAEQLERQVELQNIQMKKWILQQKNNYINNTIICQKAIVIFYSQHNKNQLLKKHTTKKFNGQEWKRTTIKNAPEPKQIFWENISLSNDKKVELTVIGWILSIFVLVILTAIFAFIIREKSKYVQNLMEKYHKQDIKLNQKKDITYALLLVFGMIFFVVLFNKIIIATLFHKFTDWERHANTYKFQFSFCLKYCLGLFFTTALMTVIVEVFFMGNIYQYDFGVIQEQTIMFLVNSLFVPLFWLINPIYIKRLISQSRHKGKRYLTQQEANKLMEMPQYDIGKRYAQVIEVMWFTFLYISLIPIGGIFSCIGLLLYYWVDKYNLLRRSTISSKVSGNLIYLTMQMLDFTLVFRMIGDIFFDYQVRGKVNLSSIILLGVAVIYQLIPLQSIIHYFNKERFKLTQKSYELAQISFTETYYDDHILFSKLKQDREFLSQSQVHKITSSKIIPNELQNNNFNSLNIAPLL